MASAAAPAAVATAVAAVRPKLHGYAFWRSIGSPTCVVAPMVDASELAFRMMCREFGAQLAYTPMIHSRMTVEHAGHLESVFSTCEGDRPLIAQFCGNEPDIVLAAARRVEHLVDAVDLNLGCPQNIAKRGRYGAFLLEDTANVVAIIAKLHAELAVPVTAKIRILPTWEQTISTVLAIQAAGASAITVHGRTRHNMKQAISSSDWDVVARIKAHPDVNVPIILNGGIACHEDVAHCLAYTRVDAVMASEGLLENPGLFSNQVHVPSGVRYNSIDMAVAYARMAERWRADNSAARGHVIKMLFAAMNVHTDVRDIVVKLGRVSWSEVVAALMRLRDRLPPLPSALIERLEAEAAAGAFVGPGPTLSPMAAAAGAGAEAGGAEASAATGSGGASAGAAAAPIAGGAGAGVGSCNGDGGAVGTSGIAALTEAELAAWEEPARSLYPRVRAAFVAWGARRSADAASGCCKPWHLFTLMEPGDWYMRHRKGACGPGEAPAGSATVAARATPAAIGSEDAASGTACDGCVGGASGAGAVESASA